MAVIDRYNDNLANPVASGNGCHSWLLSTGNLGVLAGIEPEQIHMSIRRVMLPGKRRISDREISDAIKKALADHGSGTYVPQPRPEPIVSNGKTTLHKIIESANIRNEADLWESSPVRLMDAPDKDAVLLFENLYGGSELVWTGNRHEPGNTQTIRPVFEFIALVKTGQIKLPPFFIFNPLSGLPAQKKDGTGVTYRSDACVRHYRYCMAEFDTLSIDQQICFWSAAKLPVRALIHTGNKSIHAIIDVQKLANVQSYENWQTHIKGRLYQKILIPLGVDAACSNPARLSRLPGHYREEKEAYQKLLWLAQREN